MFSTISFVHLSHCLSHWKLTLSCWSKRNLAWHRSCHCDKENLVLAFAVGFFPSGVLPQSQFGGSFGNYFGLVSACYATSEALRVHPIERLSSERRPAKGFVMLCYARARCTFFCSLLLASREVQPLACSYAHPTDVGSNTAGDITCQWPRNVVLHRQTTRWNGHRLFKSKSFSPLASSIYFGYLYEDLGREKRPLLCRDCCSGPSSLQRHGTPRKHFFFFLNCLDWISMPQNAFSLKEKDCCTIYATRHSLDRALGEACKSIFLSAFRNVRRGAVRRVCFSSMLLPADGRPTRWLFIWCHCGVYLKIAIILKQGCTSTRNRQC